MTSTRPDSTCPDSTPGKLLPSTIASRNVRIFLKLDDSHESVDLTEVATSADTPGSAAPSGASRNVASPESPEAPLA